MSSVSCHFCSQCNPAGSKFCNQCGSPVDLKPCAKCEAMNHIAVDRCYQCGTPFAIDENLEFAEAGASARNASAAPSGAGEVGVESGSTRQESANPLPERIPVVLSQRMDPASAPADAGRHERAHAQASAQDLPGADDDPWIDPRRALGTARDTARRAERRGATRAAFAGVVVCAVVGAGYYAYQAQMLPRVANVARALHLSNDPAPGATPASSSATSPSSPSGTVPASPAATAREESRQGSTAAGPATIAPATSAAAAGASPPGGTNDAPSTSAVPSASTSTSAAAAAPGASTQPPATSTPASTTSRRRNVSRGASPPSTRNGAAQPAIDKDAAATQRLIERDLGRFLPPEHTQQSAPR
jgi:hypothetical protein